MAKFQLLEYFSYSLGAQNALRLLSGIRAGNTALKNVHGCCIVSFSGEIDSVFVMLVVAFHTK